MDTFARALADGMFKQLLHVETPLPYALPSRAVEIDRVNQLAQGRDALRLVEVDVVERFAGIEAMLPTDLNAAAELSNRFEEDLLHAPEEISGGWVGQSCLPVF